MEETQLHLTHIGPPPTLVVEPSTPVVEPPSTPRVPLAYDSPSQLMAPLAQKEAAEVGSSVDDLATSSSSVTSSSSESDTDDEFEKCDCVTETAPADIPYISVYETEKQVKERGYFTQPPQASIVDVERDTVTAIHLVDRYIYTIEVRHGKHQWLVVRRYSDFRELNSHLLLFRATENLTAPMHRLKERREERKLRARTLKYGHDGTRTDGSGRKKKDVAGAGMSKGDKPNTIKVEKTIRLEQAEAAPSQAEGHDHDHDHDNEHPHRRHRQKACKLPHFPILPDTAVSQDKLLQRKDELGRFLSAVLHVPAYRNHSETLEFLGVSRLSFVADLGLKSEEGFIKKRPGGCTQFHGLKRFFVTRVAPWRKRWLVLKDSYLVYLRPKQQEISEVLLFESGFNVDQCTAQNGGNKKAITISNLHRALRIKCHHEWDADGWRRALQEAIQKVGGEWLKPNRFGSSYPIREDGTARWFVDGRSFMEEAANMIDMAKEDIFITDWWLSPEVLLKRPYDTSSSHWRLDMLLKKKAEQGIKVFVLLYKEVAIALSINSFYSKVKLQALHPNIKVQRHRGVMQWAHHEKLIVIDQTIAFVGGIDLCYGRWDDHRHRLNDMAGTIAEQSIHLETDDTLLAGQLLTGLVNYGKEVEKQNQEEYLNKDRRDSRGKEGKISKRRESRIEKALTREDSRESSPEFGEPKDRKMSKGLAYLAEWRMKARAKKARRKSDAIGEESEEEKEQTDVFALEPPVEITGNEKWWVGKDYVNFIFKDFHALDSPFADFIDRTRMPRMPWHDIASVVYGSPARDVARHFIERWNACKVEKCHDDNRYPFLLPKSYENVEIPKRLRRKAIGCSIQIIRSASLASTGRRDTETSIYEAYIRSIEQAEHYVYIENQFFVSQVGAGKVVLNGIAQALFDRIVKAHKNNESFRVYVIMPLLPGFEVGMALFTVLHWTYLSISKGSNSLLKNLETVVGDPSRYISFCSLRKYDYMGERLVTELIYIHSKLLIVDDRIVIIGSANINDRSQLGDRDSEVAIYAEDTQFEPSTMNGQPYQAGKYASSLRRQLFNEHLGLLEPCPAAGVDEHSTSKNKRAKIDITDPASEEFFELWKEIAAMNTQLFEEVFDCLPNDNIRSQHQLAEYRPGNAEAVTDKRHASERVKKIRGFLVQLPLKFLIDSDLTPPLTTKEGWAPSKIFI